MKVFWGTWSSDGVTWPMERNHHQNCRREKMTSGHRVEEEVEGVWGLVEVG